ncbi:MAG: hypothetical protein A2Y86_02335 [Candidatus Aminicenantes bacterium RBG_13_62_12]|nr:MAG: hypothetical protein A2Y86_02335 [Candidatus Aminicenantes bacterium RBG_13_62_12]
MTQINILIKPFQPREIKVIGKIIFVLGAGFLSFSITCLLGFKDFCAEHPGAILFILLTSLALILAGESLIAFSNHLDPDAGRGRMFFRWMAEPLIKPKQNQKRNCYFCGTDFILPPVSDSKNESQERDFDRLIFGVCLGCGKTVCPKCASFNRLELKTKSFHCPSCGSLVL